MPPETEGQTQPASAPDAALVPPAPQESGAEATPPPASGTPPEDTAPPTLAQHAEALGNRARDDHGRYVKPSKHRASKDGARAEDAPRISELTAKRRDAEAERDRYKADLEAARAELAARKAVPEPRPEPRTVPAVPQTAQKPRQDAPEAAIDGFGEAEPQITDFAAESDPYAAWIRAVNRWDRKKETWEADQQHAKAAEQQEIDRILDTHFTRVRAFEKTHPEFQQAIANGPKEDFPVLLKAAIADSDNGPAFMLYLATHPERFDEMFLLTEGKPVTDVGLATTQRTLSRWILPVVTGSGVPPLAASPPVPKPPNPVRTGPMKASDEPPADVHSLSEHQKAWGVRRR